jgi:hypothetical protein
MSDFGDAIGVAGEGALLSRAVEPRHGEARGYTQESACLNCGTPLVGPHCHACGQRGHVHRTVGAFFHDLLHGVLHFEGKTWRTLPLLVWMPGKLTREYIDGKRASYVSPIALFLFVMFLSFALFSALGGSDAMEPQIQSRDQLRAAYDAGASELTDLRRERAALAPGSPDAADLDRRIEDAAARQQALGAIDDLTAGDPSTVTLGGDELPADNPLVATIDRVRDNPALAAYKLQTNAYKFSWMLIPLSVPFVWLLFPFSRRFGAYDHTVFTTYSITFMIAIAALAALLTFTGFGWIGWILLLYAPWHMYRQLRGTYALGRWGALWRMLMLSVFAWIAIALFVTVIGVMAA